MGMFIHNLSFSPSLSPLHINSLIKIFFRLSCFIDEKTEGLEKKTIHKLVAKLGLNPLIELGVGRRGTKLNAGKKTVESVRRHVAKRGKTLGLGLVSCQVEPCW